MDSNIGDYSPCQGNHHTENLQQMGARIAQLQSSVGGKGGTPIEIEEEECQETNPRVVVVKSTVIFGNLICHNILLLTCSFKKQLHKNIEGILLKMLRNICYKLEPVHCPKIQHKILQEQVKMQRSIFRPNLDQQLKQQVQGTGAFIQGHELIPKCYSNVLQVLMMNEYTQVRSFQLAWLLILIVFYV